MIQRIQTVYLLLAALAVILFLFVPFGVIMKNNEMLVLKGQMNIVLIILVAGIALIALVSIFLFKNRVVQMRIVLANCILSALFIGFVIFGVVMHILNDEYKPQPGIILPLFVFIFNFLAHRSIKHDENLVRSMDRLR
jgi:peptidoglycan/LPS O-acetylase OafA/YrhL